ncbi:CD225/dispanin family protein [Nostoc sp. UIC 10630]|jgi:hypothetical protein|uniref:CD225/dispanin family protein n=1 Tax=Nostoc sp. UIC 10630 TaxID=2100146 RepID=UPI0013D376EA|nr:CD225/dispanin family protein [Nostoc sp. UIC 10630]MBD2507794.1 CD225/dispanin family protein [Desmonostoc muscorum FACHB-395]NEU83893.1 CD225/dispanin family protein [Nostoc sp. UIC 10630]
MQSNKVPNYLPQAILLAIFCCQPFGIVAIIYAAQVNAKFQAGDYEGATTASDNAKKWCWISFGAAILFYLLIFIIGSLNQ